MSRESSQANRHWRERLELPYPLLSDLDGEAGRAFQVVRRIAVGGWSLELLRRATLLADAGGRIAAVWDHVRIRGHARQVIEAARAFEARPGG